ncbi:hypothetical protein WJX73_006209 [Symbiochloris irregularis]|uniref:t-SNARE coiled-coil homology domain-containing protein n=1 Tax=Symbiochloris irregularis TaxID=706552 RepID=A0AAW1PEG6_9CHLO
MNDLLDGFVEETGSQPSWPPQNNARQPHQSTDPFLQDTADIKRLLGDIKAQQGQVERLHEQCKLLTTSAEIKDGRLRCQTAVQKVTESVKRVRDQLDNLEVINTEIVFQARRHGMADTPEIQMRVSVMSGLTAKLQDLCISWAAMQNRWHEDEKSEVGRQLYTVTGQQFSDEELQEVVDSGGQDRIYQQALMAPGAQRDVRAMLTQIEQRHTEMKAVEMAMLDLQQVFLQMSAVVAEQGEQLDRIETWVLNAQGQMREGLAQLIEAKKHRRSAAQKKAITFVSGVGLVAGGIALAASGPGAVVGIPMAVIGAGVVGISAL